MAWCKPWDLTGKLLFLAFEDCKHLEPAIVLVLNFSSFLVLHDVMM
uniref:Uncharacterized protein n=1 Tax=Arundo donax TaxID=35708 RepID=A0A0A9AXI7_ARUDO